MELPVFRRSASIPGGSGAQRIGPGQTAAGAIATGLGAAAEGVGNVAGVLDEIQKTKESAWITRTTGEAAIFSDETTRRLESESTEGAPGHVGKVRQTFTEYRDGLLAAAPSRRARDALAERLTNIEVSTVRNAGAFQARADLTKRASDFDAGLNSHVFAVQRDPSRVAETLAIVDGDLDAASVWMPAEMITRARESVRERIGIGAASGMIQRSPSQAISALNGGMFDELVPPEKVAALIKSAEAEQRSRNAEARAARAAAQREFLIGFEDEAAFLSSGGQLPEPSRFTEENIRAMFKENEANRLIAMRNQAVDDGEFVHSVRTETPEDILAILEADRPDALDPENFRADSARFERRRKLAQDTLAARFADPAAAAIEANRDIASAFDAIGQAQTPEDAAQAAEAYISRTMAEQERLGVPETVRTVLPQRQAKALVTSLQQQQPDAVPQAMQQMLDTYAPGGMNVGTVLADLRRAGLPDGAYIASIYSDDPVLAAQIAAAAQLGPELTKTLPPTDVKDIKEGVLQGFVDYASVFAAGDPIGNSASNLNALVQQAENVAMLQRRNGMSTSAAVDQTVKRFVDDKYTIVDGGRVRAIIPVEFDASAIEAGAEEMLGRIDTSDIAPFGSVGGIGFIDDARTEQAVRNNSFWVNSGAGDTLTLMVGFPDGSSLPVRRKNGAMVTLPFDRASGFGAESFETQRREQQVISP